MSDVKMPNLQAVFGGNKITENKSVIEEQPQDIKFTPLVLLKNQYIMINLKKY